MSADANDGQAELVAKAFGAFGGVPFAFVAYFLFEDFLLAGVLLLAEGIASYHILAYVMSRGEEAANVPSLGGVHAGALGFGLSVGTVAMFVGRFAEINSPVAIAGGLLVATVAYVVLAQALPPAGRERPAL
ncbi:hypothetical protein [Halostella sp. PRR32]|uniref:hypothetical protein n=1 Tax=Halostella sp. PRR32 TaxID=3098147 RepID=UPI002B1E1CFC|nr:hypothetical protein [Halostella sp. PRR32]